MRNIHFAVMFGVEFEMDLFDHWSDYYLKCKFDSYHAILHSEYNDIPDEAVSRFRSKGFTTEIAPKMFHGNGILRKLILENYSKSLPPDDILVTADADEYQSYRVLHELDIVEQYGHIHNLGAAIPLPLNYRDLLESYDVLSGFLVDRYSDTLDASRGDPFLQYPYEECYTGNILKNAVPPQYCTKSVWPQTRRSKILAAPVKYDTAFSGSHCMLNVPADARIKEGLAVYHFAWRESARRKVAVKSYFSQENLSEIFDGDAPDQYKEELAKRDANFVFAENGKNKWFPKGE